MANVWQREDSGWVRRPLSEALFTLVTRSRAARHPMASAEAGAPVMLRRCGDAKSALWVLISSGAEKVHVNGQPLLAGLCVLRDRDEIQIGAQSRFYYSTEELARVEPYPGGEGPVFCARCRQEIKAGSPAVRCPACGHWCEQSESKPCWTYGPACPMCDQPTDFDTGLRWTPEDL